jgi:uncharacterized membrane protein YkoI
VARLFFPTRNTQGAGNFRRRLIPEGATMRTLKSKAAVVIVVILSSLALGPLTLGRDAGPVVPIGALAHAASGFEAATGGKVLEIRLADAPGAPAFEAAIAKGDRVLYMRIASPSDDVTEIKVTDLPPWLLNYHMESYMRSIAQAKVPLTEAITKAEKRDHAPAVDAGLAKPLSGTNAVLAYFVETMKGSKRQESAVDATTGAFIENPDSLFEPHTPVDLARRLAP